MFDWNPGSAMICMAAIGVVVTIFGSLFTAAKFMGSWEENSSDAGAAQAGHESVYFPDQYRL